MDTPYLFISYSRIEFYFVEALAHQLRTLRVPYWFDVEQLEMGKDWQVGIDNGLANCEALVLVVSHASIGSSNVKYEWDEAQKANKPVYLAMFEAVDLPPELSNVPVTDFRGNFKQGAESLTGLFQAGHSPSNGANVSNSAPRPNRYKLPTRLPRDVLIVFLTLLFISVGGLIAAVLLAPLSLSLTVLFVIFAVGYGNLCRMFITRRYVHPEIASALLFSLLTSAFTMLLLALNNAALLGANRMNPFESPILIVLFSIKIVASFYSFFAMGHSPAIFRWCPLGPVPPVLRDAALHIQRKRHIKFTPHQKCYSLSYASADERISAQVRRAMVKAFYEEVPVDQGTADHNLVVLSNATPIALVEAHINQLTKPVSIVGSSIRSATPDEKELRAVTRFQWVDHRSRHPDNLIDMAEILWLEDNGQPVSQADYHIVPESFGQPVVPLSVFLIVIFWRFVAAAVGTFYVFQIVGTLLPNGHFLHQVPPHSLGAALLTGLQIVLPLVLLWLCVQVMQRSINFTTSLLGPAIVVISGLVIPLIIAQNSIPGLLSNVSDLISNLDQRLHIAVVSAMLIFGVTFVVVYGWALRGLYHWLPRSNIALRPDSTPTLQQPFGWTLWRTTIAFVAIFAVVVLALTQVNYDLTTKTEQIDHLQITMPRFIDSLPIQNSVPTTFPPEDKDRSQQFVNDHSAYGALLWMGTLRPDPTTHISIPIGIWRNQPSSSLPETKIDQILQSTGPNISNVIRAKITNGDTVIDGVTYDITIPASDGSPANTDTVWMMVASTDPYSYIFAASGDKKSMVQAYLILNQMVNSIVIN